MNSSQSLGLVVCMPGPHGGTSLASIASTNSGVTRISSSTSLVVLVHVAERGAQIGHFADPGQADVLRLDAVLHQAGDGQRLPGLHFHAGSASRDLMPGTVVPLMVKLWRRSSSLIRGRTSRRILPLPSTIGTKSICVPYSSTSMEIVPRLCGTGIGNFAAGVERGRPAADGHQRRLGHDLHQVVLPQGVQHAEEGAVAVDHAEGERAPAPLAASGASWRGGLAA